MFSRLFKTGADLGAAEKLPPVQLVPVDVPEPDSARSLMESMTTALANGTQPSELEKFVDLYDRLMQMEAKKQFQRDFALFQAQVPPIPKTKEGKWGWYAPIEVIDEKIRPVLAANNLSTHFETKFNYETRMVHVTCFLTHTAGYVRQSSFTAPMDREYVDEDGKPVGSNEMQKGAGAETFAKRRALTDVTGIATVDVDLDGDYPDADEKFQTDSPDGGEDLFPMGAHKGVPWSKVPIDYLDWVVKKVQPVNEFKRKVIARAKRELEARKKQMEKEQQDEAAEQTQDGVPVPSKADIVRSIMNAKSVEELQTIYASIPPAYLKDVKNYYNARMDDIEGQSNQQEFIPKD